MCSLDSTCSFPSVALADGSTSSVQGIILVNATSSLSLSSVLYVTNFPFSLLTVSKITRALNCSVKFYLIFYEFQELGSKKMIGTWREKDELYYLDLVSNWHSLIQFHFLIIIVGWVIPFYRFL